MLFSIAGLAITMAAILVVIGAMLIAFHKMQGVGSNTILDGPSKNRTY